MSSSTEHERAVKRKLIDATNAIRKKIRAFRSGVQADKQNFQKTFKSIIEPLTEIVNVVKSQKPVLKQKDEVVLKHKAER